MQAGMEKFFKAAKRFWLRKVQIEKDKLAKNELEAELKQAKADLEKSKAELEELRESYDRQQEELDCAKEEALAADKVTDVLPPSVNDVPWGANKLDDSSYTHGDSMVLSSAEWQEKLSELEKELNEERSKRATLEGMCEEFDILVATMKAEAEETSKQEEAVTKELENRNGSVLSEIAGLKLKLEEKETEIQERIQASQIARLEAAFDSFDVDGSGILDEDEFMEIGVAMHGKGWDKKRNAAAFKQLDSDGDRIPDIVDQCKLSIPMKANNCIP